MLLVALSSVEVEEMIWVVEKRFAGSAVPFVGAERLPVRSCHCMKVGKSRMISQLEKSQQAFRSEKPSFEVETLPDVEACCYTRIEKNMMFSRPVKVVYHSE